MEVNEWTTIPRTKNKKKYFKEVRKSRNNGIESLENMIEEGLNRMELIETMSVSLKNCHFVVSLESALRNVDISPTILLVGGIGHVYSNWNSIYQLCLILLLNEIFKFDQIFLFDPNFVEDDLAILSSLQLSCSPLPLPPLSTIVDEEEDVLVFLPHVPLGVLEVSSGVVGVIGNSSQMEDELKLELEDWKEERIEVESGGRLEKAFNSLSYYSPSIGELIS